MPAAVGGSERSGVCAGIEERIATQDACGEWSATRTEKPIQNAVVFLKNLRTNIVISHFSDDQGNYRFTGLDPNVDYEVYAEFDGAEVGFEDAIAVRQPQRNHIESEGRQERRTRYGNLSLAREEGAFWGTGGDQVASRSKPGGTDSTAIRRVEA